MAKCKACDAEIIWIRTRKGKLMPADADQVNVIPARNGKRTYISEAGDVFHGEEASEDMNLLFNEYVKGYEVHFGTCPKYRRGDR